MNHSKKTVVLAISALLLTDLAAAAAGNFLLVTGNVQVRDAKGIDRLAVTGSTLDSGETVLTQNGRAQIRFTDSGQISLQPATEFKLADYRYRESGSSEESAIFNLIKGGVRAISGLVGRRTKSDYKMITSTATIGIRGTEFQATMCSASCAQADGLYVQTGEGIVTVANALGEVEVGRGETAYVASPQSSPQKTSSGPAMTTSADLVGPPPLPVFGAGEFQPGTIAITNPLGAVTPFSSVGLTAVASGSLTLDLSGYTSLAPSNSNATVGTSSGTSTAGSAAATIGNFDPGVTGVVGAYISEGKVNGFVISGQSATQTVFTSVVASSVLNAGNSGELYWGRWSGGTLTTYAGLNGTNASSSMALPSTTSIHYLLSTSVPTVPTSGQATFSFIGGTPSTDLSGKVGSGITSGSLTAYFGSNVVGANFIVQHGGPSTNIISASMPMNSGNRAAFSSQNAGGYVSVGSSSVAGILTGSGAPTGAGISYNINGVVGVGAFR